MPLFLKNGRSCLFIHIPKCGGTTVEREMVRRKWDAHFLATGYRADALKGLRCSPQHYHAEILEHLLDLREVDCIVAITRNPIARLVSEFKWQRRQGSAAGDIGDWIPRVLEECAANRLVYDNHIRPQTDFLATSRPPECFRLEEGGVQHTLDRFGATGDGRRQWLGRGRIAHRKVSGPEGDARLFEAACGREAMIREFYERDFEILGYA